MFGAYIYRDIYDIYIYIELAISDVFVFVFRMDYVYNTPKS